MADELAMYQDRIRKVWHEGEWWFSAIDAANTETLLRIILSAPSPKAEPFKRWLAKVGTERLQEEAELSLAEERLMKLYQKRVIPTSGFMPA